MLRGASPVPESNARATAELRVDLKVVHQATCARQAEPEAMARRMTIQHGLGDVRNTGARVHHDDYDAQPFGLSRDREPQLAPAAVFDRVAADLAGRGGQLFYGSVSKFMALRKSPNLAARGRNVGVVSQRQADRYFARQIGHRPEVE
jgi:hypothetical protein